MGEILGLSYPSVFQVMDTMGLRDDDLRYDTFIKVCAIESVWKRMRDAYRKR